MLLTLSLAATVLAAPSAGANCVSTHSSLNRATQSVFHARPVVVASQDSALRATFESGQTFRDFLGETKARREGWHRVTDSARVDATLIARARAAAGPWKVLVVAIDACNDSMNSLPFIASLADSASIDLRVVLPGVGKSIQEAHRSVDGRLATPTFVLINERWEIKGCIVELPSELRTQTHNLRSAGLIDSARTVKSAYYSTNRGVGISTEFVEMLEAAAAGSVHCDRQPPSQD